nr:cory-CC-star protein [uncultured Halomonas sp.]
MRKDSDSKESAPRSERIKAWLSQARFYAEEFYSSRYRGAIARAQRDEDDLFMLMVFSELMGVPNPVSYYTLELQPLMLERFHEWHRRMGMEHSPLDDFRCC